MTDIHNKSFFGQKVGMIVSSNSQTDPFIFLKFLKKKANNNWEKPSQGEGKSVKMSLEEMIIILNVLSRKMSSWKSVHSFNNDKTPISVNWNGDNNDLWINVGDYGKNLKFSQVQFLKLLIEHMLNEKIEFATSGTQSRNTDSKSDDIFPQEKNEFFESDSYFEEEEEKEEEEGVRYFNNTEKPIITESIPSKNNSDKGKSRQMVKVRVKRATEKAILLCFSNGKEVWFPKSTVHSEFDTSQNSFQQNILVDSWILEKNSL